jgi:hypothetical protein
MSIAYSCPLSSPSQNLLEEKIRGVGWDLSFDLALEYQQLISDRPVLVISSFMPTAEDLSDFCFQMFVMIHVCLTENCFQGKTCSIIVYTFKK